jgi:hypothetical protein
MWSSVYSSIGSSLDYPFSYRSTRLEYDPIASSLERVTHQMAKASCHFRLTD